MVDTFVTIITFAINGPDVNLIMLYNEDSYAEDSIAYPILSHILWINFGAVVSFLFTTFLVSSLNNTQSIIIMYFTLCCKPYVCGRIIPG